jgi:hypothetical protein
VWQSVYVYNDGFINKKLFLTVRDIRKCPEFSAADLLHFQECFATVSKFTFFGISHVNVEQSSATFNIPLF